MRKLARVRDCLSFLIPSTRVVVYRHYYEKFSPGFLSLVLSFLLFPLVLCRIYLCLPFYLVSFYLLFRLFPHFLYPHRPKDLFFSFFLLHQLRGSIHCHATEQTIAQEEKKKRKAVAVVAIIIVCIYLDRFFCS
jgi:hypothetical protein